MKKLSHQLILLSMVFVAIACNDDSPQQEDIKENKTYVPNSGLRYKRISGNVYDIQFYYDSKGRADSVVYITDKYWRTHFQFHYNPDKVTAICNYQQPQYLPTTTYDTIVPFYNKYGCVSHVTHTGITKQESGSTETVKEKIYMEYDDSMHLSKINASHHNFFMSSEGFTRERNADIGIQLGWDNKNLYDITATKDLHHNENNYIKWKETTNVSHVFTYDEQSPADFLNKYEAFTYTNTLFLYEIGLDYLRPFALLGLLGKGPQMMPDSCMLSTGTKFDDSDSRMTGNRLKLKEDYRFDSEGRVSSQIIGNIAYEY